MNLDAAQPSLEPLPSALSPLAERYQKISTMASMLQREQELAARADLAEHLVHCCALVEDAKEQSLYRSLGEHVGYDGLIANLRHSAEQLGNAMVPIYRATRHAVPIDVHKVDRDGFELDLAQLCAVLEEHLGFERRELFPALERLSYARQAEIASGLEGALRHALEHPLAPHNRVSRWLLRIDELLERATDAAEVYRPGTNRAASWPDGHRPRSAAFPTEA